MAIAATVSARAGGISTGSVHEPRLRLLAEFQLSADGTAVRLPHSVERVVAFLGINRVPVNRSRVAATLWPDVTDARANGDLRSSLWRLRRITGVLSEDGNLLALAPNVAVDIHEMVRLSHAMASEEVLPSLARLSELVHAEDILPGWDEEWLVVERERYRLMRLRALERAAEVLLEQRRLSGALDAALAAVATEPYRESAHRLVIRGHLAEGNHADAIRAYDTYRHVLDEELGIQPSSILGDLIAPLLAQRRH
jgi:DNA-binding SARP family transcriptional activator